MYFINQSFVHYVIEKDSEDIACSVLDWKFQYYDVSGDGELYPYEQYKFVEEIDNYINFAEFEDQMIAKMDTSHDKLVQFDEWFKYFTADVTEGKIIFRAKILREYLKPCQYCILRIIQGTQDYSFFNTFSL